MKTLINFLLLFIVANSKPPPTKQLGADLRNLDFDSVWKKHGYGSMGNYKTPGELNLFFKAMVGEFPEVITRIRLGKTYRNITINGFVFMKRGGGEFDEEVK